MRAFRMALAGFVLSGAAAQAGGDALVIGNSRYDAIQTFLGAGRVAAAADTLRRKGFDVSEVQDGNVNDMTRAFYNFVRDLQPEDGPVIVVLAGTFVHSAGGAYLLPVEDRDGVNEAQVLMRAFSLDAAMSVLAQYPGNAVLVLGETDTDLELGAYLTRGVGALEMPQGVTLVRGEASDVARFAARDLVREDQLLRVAAERYELTVGGYAPQDLVVLSTQDVTAPVEPVAPAASAAVPPADAAADEAAWRAAQKGDTRESYDLYLDTYPDGTFASAARQRLQAIDNEPLYQERRAEEKLELDRAARRAIQRDLTLLGYDTNGIDGIFGSGTRGAIRGWQKSIGVPETGYMARRYVGRLNEAAVKRAEELEVEARKKQEAQEKADRALWTEVERKSDEASLRKYLRSFPNGAFAGQARELLETLEKQREERAARQDTRAWRKAKEANTLAAYRAYVEARPTGVFVEDAKVRIQALQLAAQEQRNIGPARDQEKRMNLNDTAKLLAEQRLSQLGLKPGKVDGKFNDATRRAIRRYQETRGMPVSGYLDDQTIIRLLAGGLVGTD